MVMSHWIEMSLDMIEKIIVGKRYEDGAKARKWRVSERAYLSGQFVISDVIPFPLLRWMDPQGYIKGM